MSAEQRSTASGRTLPIALALGLVMVGSMTAFALPWGWHGGKPPAVSDLAPRQVRHQVGSILPGKNLGRVANTGPESANEDPKQQARIAAVTSYLRHIYAMYFGIRACSELGAEQTDGSYRPTVSLDMARAALRTVEAAARSVRIDVDEQWREAAPKAIVTAEALKREPEKNIAICRRIGGLFRLDEANLQNLLTTLGSKQAVVPKDF